MFTGIITDVGNIINIPQNNYFRIATNYSLNDIIIGDSICCSGICLTVTNKGAEDSSNYFDVNVSDETLTKTSADSWKINSLINLEQSLKVGDKLGGHILTGHVDTTAIVTDINSGDNFNIYSFSITSDFIYLVAKKGSIAINGISLTVNYVDDQIFKVNIIPHTYEFTDIKNVKVEDKVNVEIDIFARYIARNLQNPNNSK